MRELLLSIQETLRSGLDSTVYRIGSTPEQSDIFIADNEQYLPKACLFPAVGIKDAGESELIEHACGENQMAEESTFTVSIICWAPSLSNKIGGGIIGDQTQPGIQDSKRYVHNLLRGNTLGLDFVESVNRGAIPPSQTTIQDAGTAQRLVIPYVYEIKKYYMI